MNQYVLNVNPEEIRQKIRTGLEEQKFLVKKNSDTEVFTGSVNVEMVMKEIRAKLAAEGAYPSRETRARESSTFSPTSAPASTTAGSETPFFRQAKRLKKLEHHPVLRFFWPALKFIKDAMPEQLKFVEGIPLQDLLNYEDEAFIYKAYEVILQREPDSWGMQTYLQALRGANMHKVEILGLLRFSVEGRTKKVQITGLQGKYILHRLSGVLSRLPLIGYLFQWLITFLLLPRLLRHIRAEVASHTYRLAALESHRSEPGSPSREIGEVKSQLAQMNRTLQAQKRRIAALEEQINGVKVEP